MKNKKGFTLVEMLAVIVILGIVITLAVTSINGISKAIKQKQYDDLISLIKTESLKFYDETKIPNFTVQSLIDQGYLDVDDAKGNLYDPREKAVKLNCKKIKIENKKATVSGEDDCEYNIRQYVNLKLYLGKTTTLFDENKWYNSDVQICAKVFDDENNEITEELMYAWSSSASPDNILNSDCQNISSKDSYKVVANADGITYQRKLNVKIDKNAPIIKIVSQEVVANTTKTIIKLTDNDSGLKRYKIALTDNIIAASWVNINKKSIEISKEDATDGEYTVIVQDNAGNESSIKYIVENKDVVGPKCGEVTGSSTNWTNKDRTITVTCKDDGSGCKQNTYTATFASTTKTGEIVMEDNEGNQTACKVNVYVDKTAPTCGTVTGESTTWTSSDRTISVGCSDSNSGCESSNVSKTFSSTAKTGSISIKDNAGNTKSCSANVYVDKTTPTISVKNPYEGTKFSGDKYYLDLNFSDSHSGINPSTLEWYESSWKSLSNSSTSYYQDYMQAERDSTIKYRICDNVGNCGQTSTHVIIKRSTTVRLCRVGNTCLNAWKATTMDACYYTGSYGTEYQAVKDGNYWRIVEGTYSGYYIWDGCIGTTACSAATCSG